MSMDRLKGASSSHRDSDSKSTSKQVLIEMRPSERLAVLILMLVQELANAIGVANAVETGTGIESASEFAKML